MTTWTPISREELDRVRALAIEYREPAIPRDGHATIALYDRLVDAVMMNLGGLLERASKGFSHADGEAPK